MSRIVSSSLVLAGTVAVVALSACSDATSPASTRELAPTSPAPIIWTQPVLTVTPALAFGAGQVGSTSAPKTVLVTNTGTAPLTLWSAYSYGPGDFIPIVTGGNDACAIGQPIQPGAQCTFTWAFNPITVGARSGVQDIQSDGGNVLVQFSGTGFSTADVAVSIAANPTTVQVGKQLAYTITLKNLSSSPATGVTMTDVLPAGTTFAKVSSTTNAPCMTPAPGGTGPVVCSIGRIDAGMTSTIHLVVDVVSGGRTGITNTVTIASTSVDPVGENDTASIAVSTRGKR